MTTRARALAALGAYLCLAAQLVGIVHVLVVRHATCPGHGEMVHGAAPVAAPVAAAIDPDAVAKGVSPEGDEEVDEHCLLLATRRRELAGLTPAPVLVSAAAVVTKVDVPPAIAVWASRVLLRLAPKTSPPRAAV